MARSLVVQIYRKLDFITERHTMRMFYYAVLGILILQGCSGIRPYSSVNGKNAVAKAVSIGTNVLNNVRFAIDIHSVDNLCMLTYIGSITVDSNPVWIGLPAGKPAYLQFRFEKRGLLTMQGTLLYSGMMTLKNSYKYELNMGYEKGIYSYSVFETTLRGTHRRRIDLIEIQKCK